MKKLFALLLALSLLCAVSAGWAEAQPEEDPPHLYALSADAWEWFYVPSTLPDYITLKDFTQFCELVYQVPGEVQNNVRATAVTVEFLSGDAFLKDAVYAEKKVFDNDPETWIMLHVDNEKLTAPGSAVFHITLEDDRGKHGKDVPLHVLSWEDHPLVTPRKAPQALTVQVGQQLTEEELAASVIEACHYNEIAEMLYGGSEDKPNADDGFVGRTVKKDEEPVISSRRGTYQVMRTGDLRVYYSISCANAYYHEDLAIDILPYYIAGPDTVKPGEAAEYKAVDTQDGSGRTFILSLEQGDGLSFDPADGKLAAGAEVMPGSPFLLKAVPSDGGPSVVFSGMVDGDGVLSGQALVSVEGQEGFSVPTVESGNPGYLRPVQGGTGSAGARGVLEESQVTLRSRTGKTRKYLEDPEAAKQYYAASKDKLEDAEEEIIDIDGHPARITAGKSVQRERVQSMGILEYVRDAGEAYITLTSFGKDWESTPKVTLADMKKLARQVSYDPEKASFSAKDAAITLTAQGGATAIYGAGRLQLTAAYADPEKVDKKKPSVLWSLSEPNTPAGEFPEGVVLTDKGLLTVSKDGDEIRTVTVHARDQEFGMTAEYTVTLCPQVRSVTAEPANVTLYAGTDAAVTVKAAVEPASLPISGLEWKAKKEGILEIAAKEDGAAEFRPLVAGKTVVTVAEPGGKSAKVNVSVVQPVEEVTLEMKGRAKPGGTVTVKATVAPKNAADKKVSWSLDVGEETATVKNGQVKIAKTAAPGTVITVTCTAEGAPQPVTAALQITVEE